MRAWSRGETKWMLFATTLPLALLGVSLLYEWNNRVPDLRIPQGVTPNPNAFDFYQSAAQSYVPPRIGSKVDFHIDSTSTRYCALYSAEYSRRYPLARKLAYLRGNSAALHFLKQGLRYQYLQPPERDARTVGYYSRYRDLARLLLVEAHARAQRGDWDAAADSLLDTMQFSHDAPRGGALIASLTGIAIRRMAQRDFKAVLPHLSLSKTRDAARRLEAIQSTQVSAALALEEEKRAMQGAILKLIRERDFRPLFVTYGCLEGCDVSDEQYQEDLNALPHLLQIRLAWMNKPRLLSEYSRCMGWQIAQARLPYAHRAKEWPFPESDDNVEAIIYPKYSRVVSNYARCEAQDNLLLTMLALRGFRIEAGRYPRTLSELTPKYLKRVPPDPYTGKPLRYHLKPVSYIARSWTEPEPKAFAHSSGAPAPDDREYETKHRIEKVPFTVYSVGPNGRDDSGAPYLSERYSPYSDESYKRYIFDLTAPEDARFDIVAGIN